MRLSLIVGTSAALIALPAIAAPDASGTAAAAEIHAGPPPSHASVEAPTALVPRHRPAVVEHYVDLNSASRKELMTLPGIGANEAARIIANRPYLTKTELVTKNVLPVGPFVSVKNLVVAMPKTAPQGSK